MPEWKSFTFGETARPFGMPPAAPSPAMGGRRVRREVGTGFPEVSIASRTSSKATGCRGSERGFIAVTQLEDVRFQIHREPVDAPWLQIETHRTQRPQA